jgi:hypothetical protein
MEKMGRDEIVAMYRPDVERLVAYLPWLENRKGRDVTQTYEAEHLQKTLTFPVYDSVLLEFVNELGCSVFMDQNYRYVYSRYQIRNVKDELKLIQKADIMSMDILNGILSHYAFGGMTKAYLWTQGVEYQIFLKALKKAKEIIEFWDVPIIVPQPDPELLFEETEQIEETELTETPQPVEQTEPVEELEPVEQAETIEEPETVEQAEPEQIEETELTEMPEPVEQAEMAEEPETVEQTEPAEEPETVEQTKTIEEPETIQQEEQTEEIEQTEQAEETE